MKKVFSTPSKLAASLRKNKLSSYDSFSCSWTSLFSAFCKASCLFLSINHIFSQQFVPVFAHKVLTTEESIPPEIPTTKDFGLNDDLSQ